MALKQNPIPADAPKSASGASPLDGTKPGSESEHVDLPHDFGARASDTVETQYASHATLNQDPGRIQTRSNDESGGVRQAGVGSGGQGAGAGSGGDLDTDFVGFGGRGIAASIPDRAEQTAGGADRTDGSRASAASGKPAAGENQPIDAVGISNDVRRGGTVTIDRGGAPGTLDAEGADAMTTTDEDDPYRDAAGGEISRGESAGPADSSSSSARH